jgi:hypothetical protein
VDLNRLYSQHQVSLMRAKVSTNSNVRREHEFCASLAAGRIACIQRALGAAAARGWEIAALPDTSDFSDRSHGLRLQAASSRHGKSRAQIIEQAPGIRTARDPSSVWSG